MDIKKIYLLAIVVSTLSGGYYYLSGKGKKLEVDSAKSMTYSAENIRLMQTDDNGLVSVKAKADRIEQDMQKNTSRLDHFNALTFKDGQPDATFVANTVNASDDNSKVVFSDQVVATRLLGGGQKMILTTPELIGFPKTKELKTDKQVTVESPQASFISQGMQANLNSGQYEFFHIRGTYAR